MVASDNGLLYPTSGYNPERGAVVPRTPNSGLGKDTNECLTRHFGCDVCSERRGNRERPRTHRLDEFTAGPVFGDLILCWYALGVRGDEVADGQVCRGWVSCDGAKLELSIAVALSAVAASPMVAVSTVIGPIIEVPIMLALAWIGRRLVEGCPLYCRRCGLAASR